MVVVSLIIEIQGDETKYVGNIWFAADAHGWNQLTDIPSGSTGPVSAFLEPKMF